MNDTHTDLLVDASQKILITGAAGFIGLRVVRRLLDRGFTNLRCMVRPSSDPSKLARIAQEFEGRATIEVFQGNLLSPNDCAQAASDVAVVLHLAAARGEKSYPDAYMNSVLTTRNLLDACLRHARLQRFVNVSSFAVYSNSGKRPSRLLDESSPVESRPALRGEAYTFAKVRQDEMVMEYGQKYGLPYVIVRPGAVYGAGNESITSRVGIGTFGIFLHLGGSNTIPLTFVDNCADAIVLAGVVKGVDGEIFNVVDDDLPSSRQFLRLYKRRVRSFRSLYLPHAVSYALCALWEKYSDWSEGQLPPAYNRRIWNSSWRSTRYSNDKAKRFLGWRPGVSTADGLERYFQSCREKVIHA
jgi:nucleoside-diphosphate-sugar epimerase